MVCVLIQLSVPLSSHIFFSHRRTWVQSAGAWLPFWHAQHQFIPQAQTMSRRPPLMFSTQFSHPGRGHHLACGLRSTKEQRIHRWYLRRAMDAGGGVKR